MNNNRVHTLLSKASEAIVTSDGKIKRRLNSYETVVDSRGDDSFYIPDGAVNDNYGNLNYLTGNKRDRSMTSRLSQLRYVMYGAFALVLIVFSWSVYNFLIPTLSSTNEQELNSADENLATVVNEAQLEHVANLIITDNDWNISRIQLFQKHWNASSDEAKENYKTSAWFQHFSYRLDTKFNRAIYTGELFSGDTKTEKKPIFELALAVGVADPKINYRSNKQTEKNYSKLETEVAAELAKMEESKIRDSDQQIQVVADEIALAKLLTDKDGKPLLQLNSSTENAVKIAGDTENDATVGSKTISPGSTSSTITKVTPAAPPPINERDVANVFKKYASAYEKGNLNEMSSLFGVNDPNQENRIIEQLKANYRNIFDNSEKRSVNFKGINLRLKGNQATINSDYSSEIKLKNNKGVQTITANARVNLQKNDNSLFISNFELLNRSVSVITPDLTLPSANKRNRRELPVNPTPAELQDIVTKLVSAYESGNLKSFSALFAPNAKTNDRHDLNGIKADYEELFKNSNDRQMFIQGIQWTFEGKSAHGTGDLEAIVLTDNDNSVYTLDGKIQLVAQRIDGKVRITHMYHVERKK